MHLLEHYIISYFLTAEKYSVVKIHHNFLIHLSTKHLGRFHFLAIVSRAAVDTGEQLSLQWDGESSEFVPKSGLAG